MPKMVFPALFPALFALALAAISKGRSVISGVEGSGIVWDFIEILRGLGVKISEKNGVLEVISPGQGCIKEPEKQIDIGSNDEFLPLLAGIFATSDYEIFINGKNRTDFSELVLPLFEAGLRLRYGRGFTYPVAIKGTSNFLPMRHVLKRPNIWLESCLLLAGVQTLGTTVLHLSHRLQRGIYAILAQSNADFSFTEGQISVSGKNWLSGGSISIEPEFEVDLSYNAPFEGEMKAENYENFEVFVASLVGAGGKSRILGLDRFFFDESLERLKEIEALLGKFGIQFRFDEHYKSLEINGFSGNEKDIIEVSGHSYKILLSSIILASVTEKKVFLANPEILFYRFGAVMKNWL